MNRWEITSHAFIRMLFLIHVIKPNTGWLSLALLISVDTVINLWQNKYYIFQERSCSHFILPWWRHQMETFSALLALCAGNSLVPVNSPHKGQWRGALMLSLICAWINDWVNNREAGDLRRHRGHYDVNVMTWLVIYEICYQSHYSLSGKTSSNIQRDVLKVWKWLVKRTLRSLWDKHYWWDACEIPKQSYF